MIKVCHMSSAHAGLDVRIYHKECVALAAAGYDVHLVITASEEDVATAAAKSITLHPLTPTTSRSERMFKKAWRCFDLARSVNADIYHFHDPELIPWAIILRATGKSVIYDVHEDLPSDILCKDWIPLPARRLVGAGSGALEHVVARYFFSVSAATPHIAKRFLRANPDSLNINNFAIHDSIEPAAWSNKQAEVCFVGTISRPRGVEEIVAAIGLTMTDARLALVGDFRDPALHEALRATPEWNRVIEHGYVDRNGVRKVLDRAVAGLVTLHPLITFVDALPIKMFEYMAAGLPVIASDFPLWREIVGQADCGILVDPLDPQAIADAIDYFVKNREEARRMGANGRHAVLQHYNWQQEEVKLLNLYERLSSSRSQHKVDRAS